MKIKLSRFGTHNKPVGTWGLVATAGTTLVGSLISSNASKKASDNANNLHYTPVDLDKLQTQAQTYARQNAANSLALEQQYSPGVAASRAELQKQTADDLAQGGNLPTDVANQVSRSAITGANSAGLTGAAGPITAASLGTTATAYRNQNQEKAASLLAANPLPTSGLDPGSLASVAVADNTAQNQFNVSKVGAQNNANQSQANTWASALGSLGSLAGQYANSTSTKTPTSTGSQFNINGTNSPTVSSGGFYPTNGIYKTNQ